MGDHISLRRISGKSDKVKTSTLSLNGLSPAAILISLSAAVGVVMTGLGIIWPLVPVYAVQLGAGGLQVGIIIASFNLARTLFNPLAGRLSVDNSRHRNNCVVLEGLRDKGSGVNKIVSFCMG